MAEDVNLGAGMGDSSETELEQATRRDAALTGLFRSVADIGDGFSQLFHDICFSQGHVVRRRLAREFHSGR
jgi:hypothetical protein